MLQITTPPSYKEFLYMPNLKTGRIHAAAINYKDRVFVGGGNDGYRLLRGMEVLDLSEYGVGEKTRRNIRWVPIEPLRNNAQKMGFQVFDGVLYAFGGYRLHLT